MKGCLMLAPGDDELRGLLAVCRRSGVALTLRTDRVVAMAEEILRLRGSWKPKSMAVLTPERAGAAARDGKGIPVPARERRLVRQSLRACAGMAAVVLLCWAIWAGAALGPWAALGAVLLMIAFGVACAMATAAKPAAHRAATSRRPQRRRR